MVQRHLLPPGPALSRKNKKNVVFIIGVTTKMEFSMLCAEALQESLRLRVAEQNIPELLHHCNGKKQRKAGS